MPIGPAAHAIAHGIIQGAKVVAPRLSSAGVKIAASPATKVTVSFLKRLIGI